MIKLDTISKSFGSRILFDEITLQVNTTSRVGLVGRNGVGKSTLFKMMMGQQHPDKGQIHRNPGVRVNCLTQEPKITYGNTLLEEVQSAFPSIQVMEEEEAALMANWDKFSTEDQMEACERLATLQQAKEQLGHLEADVSRMLTGLGFPREQFDRKVEHFSGGWQMRINLAKVLLQGADLLLLDEPTNHLDLEAREWLEEFLKGYSGGIVVVSHDRQFLDQVVTEIAEIELSKLTLWSGNYTRFLELKQEDFDRQLSAANRQEKELAKQMAFVDRFRASATKSTQAKSREKQLAKIERIEAPKTDNQKISVRFPTPPSSGRIVLTLNELGMGFGEHSLFKHINVELERGQRVFLLGANGAGKTTLLRLILGLETPTQGQISMGSTVEMGYFSQHQLETLDPNATALESLEAVAPNTMDQTEIRGILGRFLFSGDQVYKPVHVLSGGEKSRLALARLILGGANFLLLDEPTNHMDIPAQTAMEEAFKKYEGSMLCISHDRYLIQQVATHIWELHEGHLIQYEGDYTFYLEKRDERRAMALQHKKMKAKPVKVSPAKPVPPSTDNSRGEQEKRFKQLEKEIMTQETILKNLHQAIEDASYQQEFSQFQELSLRLKTEENTLQTLNQEWETLAALLANPAAFS